MSNSRKKRSTKRLSSVHVWAHKRPWRISYRNKKGERVVKVVNNGTRKDSLLKKIEKDDLHIYGINNLTDNQIKLYERKQLL
jgi:hypothetical protein